MLRGHERWAAVTAGLLLLSSYFVSGASTGDLCPSQAALGGADAMVVALLPLHRGTTCDQVRLKPMQQMAAAQLALKNVNDAEHSDGLKIGLQIMDTCSDTKHAVRVGFKALIFSDATICKKSPLFLGFLGPDNGELLDAVQKITSVFRLSHVTPLSLPGHELDQNNYNHVATVNIAEKTRSILQLLKQVRWSALTIVHSPDADSTYVVSSLFSASFISGPCIANVIPLPAEGVDASKIFANISTVGVLVIGAPEYLSDLLRSSSFSSGPHSYIFVANQVGLLPGLALLQDLPTSILLMQEVSNELAGLEQQMAQSPIWDEYIYQQRCNYSSCSDTDSSVVELSTVQDPSVIPITQAIRLYSRSLRIAHKLKCSARPGRCAALNNMTPEEWRGILGSASDRGIRFNMEQRSFYKLYFKSQFSQGITKVGDITDGGRQIQLHEIQFSESYSDSCKDGTSNSENSFPTLPSVAPTTTKMPAVTRKPSSNRDNQAKEDKNNKKVETDNEESTFKIFFGGADVDIFDLNNYSMTEFVAVLVGAGCTIAIVFSLLIYCVYSNFRVKGDNEASRRGGSSRRSSVRST